MAVNETPGGTSSRLWAGTRWLFVVLGAGALVLGFLGLQEFLGAEQYAHYGRRPLDVLYYDLQLFVLDSAPLGDGGVLPLRLEVARFLAPAVTLFALAETVRVLLSGEWSRWRSRTAGGHVVVVGETPLADALAASALADGRRVERIAAGDELSLRSVGAAGADVIHACVDHQQGGGAPNIAAVATAVAVVEPGLVRSGPLRAYAWIDDQVLGRALAARWLSHATPDGVRLDFLVADELAARELVRSEPLGAPLMIIGLGAFGQSLLIEYARRWRLLTGAGRLPVTLVDDAASTLVPALLDTWDVVRDHCDVTVVDGPAPVPAANRHRVYVCYDDEQRALSTALTMIHLWPGDPGSLVVRLDRLKHHSVVFGSTAGHLLDDLRGRIRMIDTTVLACRPMVLDEDLTERLARAVHAHYLTSQVAKGTPMGANASMVEWDDLAEDARQANRGQAAGIGAKIQAIGATVAPRVGPAEPFAFTPAELDQLAELEHERWCEERTAAGWTYAETRDNDAKQHPSLVEWAVLSPSERAKDREAVQNLPAILAEMALQIVRL
ncbi:RyR domain-containing protein [Actinoplanes rectilineatus]|uniref:RyR domain-containing protein n=1 Tax=Actinoplanes rectilineatus TaxID=113571 RepID=UPI0005F27DD3|nr:RyR domain-containing protein [Actinoplanes rectilineatus]